jgi:hypothetical protein
MFTALLLLAAADVRPSTQVQFREQARVCGVSVKYDAHEGYEARLSADGKELTIRDKLPNGRQIKCMMDWANKRHLTISLLQS